MRQFRAGKRLGKSSLEARIFTIVSTASEILAAKLGNSADRSANPERLSCLNVRNGAQARENTRKNPFLELQISRVVHALPGGEITNG